MNIYKLSFLISQCKFVSDFFSFENRFSCFSVYFLGIFFRFLNIDFDGYYCYYIELKRVNPDRSIFFKNVELTPIFFILLCEVGASSFINTEFKYRRICNQICSIINNNSPMS